MRFLNAARVVDPVMAEVQVPPGEPRRRRRSADADVGVDPLFGGGAANPQSALGGRILEGSSLHPTLVDSITIPHQHLLHSKSPPFDFPFGILVKASKRRTSNRECPVRCWFP
jgi:hypothetical protein